MPEGWTAYSARPNLLPHIGLAVKDGRKTLSLSGTGDGSIAGWAAARVQVVAGRTYRMWARFRMSDDIDPQQHLVFSFWTLEGEPFNDGIFQFRKTGLDGAEGEGRFFLPGSGAVAAEVRIVYRLHAAGIAWVEEIGLAECEPIAPRYVRVAAVEGLLADDPAPWEKVLDAAGRQAADLALLPEFFNGTDPEEADGPSAALMSRKAAEHRMYVAGTFTRRSANDGHFYNTCVLYDRNGRLAGAYDKVHPYIPESFRYGIVPGHEVPVFQTDFGTVGSMICYDSWFTDVAELLALKGAEIILFPSVGYYRSLMPARANDNGVRIVASAGAGLGIWDTTGADVERPNADPSRNAFNDRTFREVVSQRIDNARILCATFDLSQSPSAANWGGPMMSSPGGRRNRREQKRLLYRDIEAETDRWWTEDIFKETGE